MLEASTHQYICESLTAESQLPDETDIRELISQNLLRHVLNLRVAYVGLRVEIIPTVPIWSFLYCPLPQIQRSRHNYTIKVKTFAAAITTCNKQLSCSCKKRKWRRPSWQRTLALHWCTTKPSARNRHSIAWLYRWVHSLNERVHRRRSSANSFRASIIFDGCKVLLLQQLTFCPKLSWCDYRIPFWNIANKTMNIACWDVGSTLLHFLIIYKLNLNSLLGLI